MTESAVRDIVQELVDASGWDELDLCSICVYDAVFKQDFGPWKQGQKVNSLSIMFMQGIIESVDDEGNIIDRMEFEIIPKSST